jgi:hypothetical protein
MRHAGAERGSCETGQQGQDLLIKEGRRAGRKNKHRRDKQRDLNAAFPALFSNVNGENPMVL